MPQTGLQHCGDGFMGNATTRHDIDGTPSSAHHFAQRFNAFGRGCGATRC